MVREQPRPGLRVHCTGLQFVFQQQHKVLELGHGPTTHPSSQDTVTVAPKRKSVRTTVLPPGSAAGSLQDLPVENEASVSSNTW